MTRTIVRDCSSRDAGACDTFADGLAQAIAQLIVNSVSGRTRFERHPQTLEQVIALAIYRELPR
jgi:hypothetical protein